MLSVCSSRDGHDHLADLAVIGEVLAHQEVLHDLLGDGRAALRASGLREIADEGADQAALVDAPVPVEALVLGREERLLHVLGNVGEGNPFAPLVLLEHLREAFALAVEHHARARQLEALELGVIGQVGGRLVVVVDDLAEIDRRHRHLLVLAKLPIGGLQVGKIDAAKRLVLAAHRLRVVQRRGDQVVEVDVLDVERLAHMRAARAQQPRHLLLIPAAVELRLHRVRRRRHLTERKRRGKDFDEERFHRVGLGLRWNFNGRSTDKLPQEVQFRISQKICQAMSSAASMQGTTLGAAVAPGSVVADCRTA